MASLYPEAGEMVIVSMPPGTVEPVGGDDEPSDRDRRAGVGGVLERSEEEQAAHDRANWTRANRRASSESRRYMVANRLCYMWVFTYEGDGLHGPVGRNIAMHDVADFVRRFHNAFGDVPYWFSPELHPDGHGWHVNFFVPRRLPHAEMATLWRHGFVWVKDWTEDDRVKGRNLTMVETIRLAALYGCKYAVKDWSPEALGKGRRRYCCAEGHRPIRGVKRCKSVIDAIEWANHVFRQAADQTWCSLDDPDWDGPPVWALRWTIGVDPPPTWVLGYG